MVDFLGVLIILFWATSFSSPTHPPWRSHIHIRCLMLMGCAWPIQQSLLTIPGPESGFLFWFLCSLMATVKTIALGLTLIDEKKEELRIAFEDLQAHSSSPSSFTLTWSDIDSHFSSIQSSLTRQFDLIQCQNDVVPEILQKYVPPSHPRLKLLCSNMDANGLTRYIIDHSKDRQEIASELPDAFRVAPVPAKLVLDALQEFFPPNEVDNEGNKLGSLMQTRLLLLEQLTAVLPEIKADVMQRAKYLAQEWKGKINRGAVTSNGFLGFLYLLAAYGMGSDFDSSEYVEFLANVVVQNRQQGFTLCCRLNCVDKVPDKSSNSNSHLSGYSLIFTSRMGPQVQKSLY
eukprot:XP_019072788.1 PREDICTED: truncated FRIGIDA-like protein 1 isoform X3 [Vitis vinifera]